MVRFLSITVGALNVTASPHRTGIYREIIDAAVDKIVLLGGSDYAKITKPEEWNGGKLIGQIMVWTEIDKKGPWLNQNTNNEASDDDKKRIGIPDYLKPNFRYFHYEFDIATHLMIIEYKNDFNHSFGAARALKFFSYLFSQNLLGSHFPLIDVTIIPEDNSLEKILSLPKLRKLKIVVTRPNPEDLSDEYALVMQKLTDQKARLMSVELLKAPKVERLDPNDDTKKLAAVAVTNGYVEGEGKDGGLTVRDSTKEHPKKVSIEVGPNVPSKTRFMSAFKDF